MEAIHVELPDKRKEVVVFEMLRKHFGREPRYVSDHECITLDIPANNIRIGGILNIEGCTSTIRYVLAKKMGILFKISSFSEL
jgi:hypothetical protein